MRSLSILLLATSLTIACGDESKSNDSGSDAFGGESAGDTTGGTETGGTETGGTETGGAETGGSETGSDGDDTAAPACTDFSMTTMEGAAFPPSVVRLAVKIQCDGEPVTDKTEEDFSITEDGAEVSAFESDLSLVPTVTAFRLVTAMVLDMSGSIVDSGYLDDLQAAAQTFIGRLGEDQEVAIYLFDGRAEIQPLVDFTSDHDELNYAIHSLEDYEVYDPSTNLNGAVVEGLSVLDSVAALDTEVATEASMVIFTDGADMAGRVSNEAAALAVASSPHSVYAVGLGTAVDGDHMTNLGRDGYYSADDIEALDSAFDEVATSIQNEASSIYILAYCSPKRAGDHTLELQLTGTSVSTTFDFNADGFDVGCDPTDFVPVEFLDADEDGFRPYDGDCDDTDATIYPGAPEIAGDEIDQDCDGYDDEIGGGETGGDWWGSGEEGTGTDDAGTDGGGGEETGGEDVTMECTDTPGWTDSAYRTCSYYETEGCDVADGGAGRWDNCCVCGGGTWAPMTADDDGGPVPSTPTVTITPDPAMTTDDLVALASGSEAPDASGSVTYRHAWFEDGTEVSDVTGAEFPAASTSKHHTYRVEVFASDGLHESAAGTAEIHVSNANPDITEVTITPEAAPTGTELTCTATADDVDGDAIALTYDWSDGTEGDTTTIGDDATVGDTLTCTATAHDGDEGTATDTATATVTNTPPVMTEVTVSPDSGQVGDTLTCAASATDEDGDAITYSYAWSTGAEGESYTITADEDPGDTITCTATATDSYGGTSTSSATAIILNTPPTLERLDMFPTPAGVGDIISCSAWGFSDPDGDDDYSRIEWTVNGVFRGVGASFSDFGGGDVVQCTAIPFDGFDEGPHLSQSQTIPMSSSVEDPP